MLRRDGLSGRRPDSATTRQRGLSVIPLVRERASTIDRIYQFHTRFIEYDVDFLAHRRDVPWGGIMAAAKVPTKRDTNCNFFKCCTLTPCSALARPAGVSVAQGEWLMPASGLLDWNHAMTTSAERMNRASVSNENTAESPSPVELVTEMAALLCAYDLLSSDIRLPDSPAR